MSHKRHHSALFTKKFDEGNFNNFKCFCFVEYVTSISKSYDIALFLENFYG